MVKAKIPDETLREMFPRKLKRFVPSQEIYAQLKEMILKGKLKRGDTLIQEKVAQRFGVTRSAVIPVFAKLKEEGLIESSKGKRAVVK